MNRGTTRQILADLQYVHDHPSRVWVSRTPENGVVQVTIAPEPETQQQRVLKAFLFLGATCGALTLICAVLDFRVGAVVFGFGLICTPGLALVSYDRAGRAYVLRAGRDRVVVASSGPLGARNWERAKEQVRDVRIVSGKREVLLFDLSPDPKRLRSRRWKMLALDLQRERLIEVADAVREGLGMPPREWN
jgi:hypothetical protein